jgi:hypothetical protein
MLTDGGVAPDYAARSFIIRDYSMKSGIGFTLLLAAVMVTGCAHQRDSMVVGSALGGAMGALVGSAVGGSNGAILGGALGAGVGAAVGAGHDESALHRPYAQGAHPAAHGRKHRPRHHGQYRP